MSKNTTQQNNELTPEGVGSLKSSIGSPSTKSASLGMTKKERREQNKIKNSLLKQESKRKNALNSAFVNELEKGVRLRNRLALAVTILAATQIVCTNTLFGAMFCYQVYVHQIWPSDKVMLGWFGSTIVEIAGLYAIVLRGVFVPSSINTASLWNEE